MPLLLAGCTMQCFILYDFLDRLPEATAKISEWYADGRIKYHADITDGLENALGAFKTLFQPGAAHKGKMMVRVRIHFCELRYWPNYAVSCVRFMT